ncbi:MAG: hypothetical protein COA78_10420 [Blastopirellula sp.]|nr:MAG: hypothetical protein COA78_10420 [Blastopirellula sp.]
MPTDTINNESKSNSKEQSVLNLSVRQFYFLEYYYILLKSISKFDEIEQVFHSFKLLKQEHYLGESRFKKLTVEAENLTPTQENRYRYTFKQVIEDSKDFKLIKEVDDSLFLTEQGSLLLEMFGTDKFKHTLFTLMENKSFAFRYLLNTMYDANKSKSGLLIFPIYSPYQLDFKRSDIKTAGDIRRYTVVLQRQLEKDIREHLGIIRELTKKNKVLLSRLHESGILPMSDTETFNPAKYNSIVSRCRKYWLDYFLKDVYGFSLSNSAFDLWIYRGKQVGVLQVTESYPNFNGRIVYPTSVVAKSASSTDFRNVYKYPNGESLFVHVPKGENGLSDFVDCLLEGYLSLRRTHRSYFINLTLLRELVCYNMKVSEVVFGSLLERAYQMNLEGELKVSISLEVDRLPAETKATYQKQEPVMVEGRYRNIIAIDVTKDSKSHGK